MCLCAARSRLLALVLAWMLAAAPAAATEAGGVLVFAASSLKNALEEAAAAWSRESGVPVTVSFAGSGLLARQIEFGAPVDLYISANVAWMDYLEGRGLIRAESRRDLLANRLVLIAQGADRPALTLSPDLDLAGLLDGRLLALGLVDTVPAGIYARAALQSLGQWQDIAALTAQTDTVRAALRLVATGQVPYGVVYASDVLAAADITVVGTFPAASHPPIVYPGAVLGGATAAVAAASLLDYLSGAAARDIFARWGFDEAG